MPYELRRASTEDSAAVWGLLAETVAWLRSLGTDQWSNWETWKGPSGKVTRAIAAGTVWLLYDGRTPVATVTVEPYGDPDFWTAEERAEPALYVSKLAVRRSHAGRGVGALLLDWVRDLAHRADASWVRLDAWRTNERLRAYYISRGWRYLRDVDRPGRSSGALFQLPAEPMRPEQAARLVEEPAAALGERRHGSPVKRKRGRPGWRPRRR